jgi:hypothetical protein
MSHHLSDAGRFLRGLTQLSRQIVNEATRSGDSRRRPLSALEPLAALVSTGLNRLGEINISSAVSKTAWKSSVLLRQTGIAAMNAIRSSPPSTTTTITRSVEDKIPIPSHAETDSSTVTTTTTVVRDKIPIPAYPEIDTSTVKTTTTSLAKDKIPIPTHPKIGSTTVVKPSSIEQKSEPLVSTKKVDAVTYHSIEKKPINLSTSTTKINSLRVEPTFFTPSAIDEPPTPLTLEENQNLISSPPPTNAEAQARAVPTTRIGRLASFGSLAAGLGVGALGSMVRRSVGLEQVSSSQTSLTPYLSKANAERIVDTLCKVRGAALKLGQMISIQGKLNLLFILLLILIFVLDNFLVQDDIQKIFERVRQKADFMPEWQMNEVMTNELGADWRDQFHEFQDRPFAAARLNKIFSFNEN